MGKRCGAPPHQFHQVFAGEQQLAGRATGRGSLWLTGDAVWLAVPGRAEQLTLPHAAALADLRDALLEGASVTVCGQCAARRELAPEDLFGQVTIRGAAAFVEEVMAEGTRSLVY